MTTQELANRINKKEQEVAKIKARLEVLLKECSEEEYNAIIYFVETGDREPYRTYLKSQNSWYGGDAWSKANDYYSAVTCLSKYQKQLAAQEAKEETFAQLPAVLAQFRENLIEKWDQWDAWKKEQIKEQIKSEPSWSDRDAYRKWHSEMREKWGTSWHEFIYLTPAQIHKTNVSSADVIVENLITRTTSICGKITDAKGLYLDSDNQGYLIINGTVIGEKGKARVESIGAGGYNIQRYHIRVLVKEVR